MSILIIIDVHYILYIVYLHRSSIRTNGQFTYNGKKLEYISKYYKNKKDKSE